MKATLPVLITAASIAFFSPENAQAIEPIQGHGAVESAVSDGGPQAIPEEMKPQAASLTLIVDPKNRELPKPPPRPIPDPEPEPPPPPVPPSRIVNPETGEPVIDSQPALPDLKDIPEGIV